MEPQLWAYGTPAGTARCVCLCTWACGAACCRCRSLCACSRMLPFLQALHWHNTAVRVHPPRVAALVSLGISIQAFASFNIRQSNAAWQVCLVYRVWMCHCTQAVVTVFYDEDVWLSFEAWLARVCKCACVRMSERVLACICKYVCVWECA